jgi:hypothetical protein
MKPKLADDFFGLSKDFFRPTAAFEVVLTIFLDERRVNSSDTLRAENIQRKLALRIGHEFVDGH